MNNELRPTGQIILPEPCSGCGSMLDDRGCDVDDVYHFGPGSCGNYPNHNGWRQRFGWPIDPDSEE